MEQPLLTLIMADSRSSNIWGQEIFGKIPKSFSCEVFRYKFVENIRNLLASTNVMITISQISTSSVHAGLHCTRNWTLIFIIEGHWKPSPWRKSWSITQYFEKLCREDRRIYTVREKSAIIYSASDSKTKGDEACAAGERGIGWNWRVWRNEGDKGCADGELSRRKLDGNKDGWYHIMMKKRRWKKWKGVFPSCKLYISDQFMNISVGNIHRGVPPRLAHVYTTLNAQRWR